MKSLSVILLAILVIYISGCSKHNIQTENGSINGIPAITLYGSSGNEADYMFIVLSNTIANKRVFYQGTTYTYSGISSTNNIYVISSPTSIVNCTIDTLNPQITLTVNTTPSIFESKVYTAK